MRTFFLSLFFSISLFVGLWGCTAPQHTSIPDAANGPACYRVDSLLMRMPGGADTLVRRYPVFAQLWGQVFGFKDSTLLVADFSRFVQDSSMQSLEDSILRVYPDTRPYAQALGQAFVKLKANSPGMRVPEIYFYNSGFNASLLLGDSILGIGLDRFLGASAWCYPLLGIPQYLRREMTPESMLPLAFDGWVSSELSLPLDRNTVLEHMLFEGKLKWLNTQVFPDMPDTVALGYSARALEWLRASERSMWEYLSEKQQLFETNALLVAQYTRPAPFTRNFGQQSPGQAACYLGYRIVRQYMERHPDTPYDALFRIPSQQMVEGARYNP